MKNALEIIGGIFVILFVIALYALIFYLGYRLITWIF